MPSLICEGKQNVKELNLWRCGGKGIFLPFGMHLYLLVIQTLQAGRKGLNNQEVEMTLNFSHFTSLRLLRTPSAQIPNTCFGEFPMKHLKISQSDYIENLTAAAVDDVVIAFVEHQIDLGRQGEKRAWVMSEVLDLVRETFGNEACPTARNHMIETVCGLEQGGL